MRVWPLLPTPHHPEEAAGKADLSRLDRFPGWGDVRGAPLRGRTASHGLQQRRKENSKRLRDPEIINVSCQEPSTSPPNPFIADPDEEGPGREGDLCKATLGTALGPGSQASSIASTWAVDRQGWGPFHTRRRGLGRGLLCCPLAPPSDCPSLDSQSWGWGLIQMKTIWRLLLLLVAKVGASWQSTINFNSESQSIDLEGDLELMSISSKLCR